MKSSISSVSVRLLENNDKQMIFDWRNTPYLIRLGSSGKAVTWEEHCEWFDNVLTGHKSQIFIICSEGAPVGQIRFDKQENSLYLISIYILKEHGGRGIGSVAIEQSMDHMSKNYRVSEFLAIIKDENCLSGRFFEKNGFKRLSDLSGLPAGHFAMSHVKREFIQG